MKHLALSLLLATCSPAMAEAPADAVEGTPIADFSHAEESERWTVVNDDVMGGRSEGGVSFDDGAMTFSGSINTNGGGFSSVRRPLDAGVLAGVDALRLRMKGDGRGYRLTLQDGSSTRRGAINFRAPLETSSDDGWETVAVSFGDLEPSFHGDPVEAEPFDPAAASEIGLILNDATDGPFELRVEWIRTAG